jgi:RHS repeat-associated protein
MSLMPLTKSHPMKTWQRVLASVALLLASFTASAGICLDTGGTLQCSPVIPRSEWEFFACDDAAPSIQRSLVWCSVRGGTWNGTYQMCENFAAMTESNQSYFAGEFERQLWDACSSAGSGGSTCSNYQCTCTNQSYGGVSTRENSIVNYAGTRTTGSCLSNWAETVVLFKTRLAGCPDGTWGATDGGNPVCIKYPPCKHCTGNPVDTGAGAKMQVEVDYTSPAPGGLSFRRHYNSAGFFATAVGATPVNSDYWRHNYSTSILAYTGNAYVLAAAVRSDGTVLSFNLSGVEMQNNDGAANRLDRLPPSGTLTGWRLTTPEKDVELYDAQGRITSITTRSGFVTSMTYDGSGKLSTVTDAYGRTLTFTYDTNGLLATITDPASRVYTYGYDTSLRLSTVTYPDTRVRTYLYEDVARKFGLTGIVDERGTRLATYAYDSTGRASSTEHAGSRSKATLSFSESAPTTQTTVTDGFGTIYNYWFNKVGGTLKLSSVYRQVVGEPSYLQESRTYDANGNPASVTNMRGVVTAYVYDGTRNLETSRTEASGTSLARTITTTWHSTYRLPATITEPSGVTGVNLVTTFTYDSGGNLTRKNLTAGSKVREWNYTYNARGQVLTIDGPRTDATDVTTIAYYADNDTCVGCRGQVYTATNAVGHVTTFNTYDADGRPTQISDANGVATTLTYTSRGWLASRSVAGETTTYDYDFTGNLTKVTLPDGSWLLYTYDAANGLIGIDDRLGNAIDYTLDVKGNRVQENVYDPLDALKRTRQSVFDGVNRLERELGAAGQTTRNTYDFNNNVASVTDPLYRVTTNTYDFLDRLTNVNDPANGNTVFTYDTKDRLATVKDPKLSTATSYTYDGLGNLLTQVSPDTGTTTFTFDNAGNVATQTDARSVATTYSYDALNRVTAATVTDGTVSYEYDNLTTGGSYAKGKLTKVTDPSGNTIYVYDNLGRVTSKTQTVTASPSNKAFTIGYSYSSGRQTGITYPSGRAITYGFDVQGQVTSITVDGTTTILSGGEYFPFGAVKKWTWGNGQVMQRSYDLDGRVNTLTLGPSTGTYADLSQVFSYDSLNRMISANLAAGQTQSFTYDANSNRTNATINAASTTYTYPSTSHKLTSLSGAVTRSFSYDNAGNTTSTLGVTYTYDGRGRLKQAGSTTYQVNGLGQRVKKSSSGDIYFAYDEAGRLIGEYDTAGAPIQETLWIGDTPIAVVKPAQPSGFTLFYIWTDHLGTPRQITDTSNISRWEWAHDDPFGNNAPNENPAGAGTFAYNLRFPGQYFDSETGNHYNWARDYDSRIGRYIQSDPVGLKAGANTYAYVRNDPLALIDPSGESSCGPSGYGDLVRTSWGIEVCTWSATRSKGSLCAYDCPSGFPLIVLKSNPFAPCPLVWVRTLK